MISGSTSPGMAKPSREACREGQSDEGDRDAECHEDQRKRHPRPDLAPLVGRETRRNETPQLVKHDRRRERDTDHQRELDDQEERTARRGEDEGFVERGLILQDADQVGSEEIAHDRGDDHGENRDEKAASELRKVLDDGHDLLVA